MKHLLLLFVILSAACVHVARTSSDPISGRLVDPAGHPIVGDQVWAYCRLPGGFLDAPTHVSFGPALTQADGSFVLKLRPVRMIQTGSIFDGTTEPTVLVVDRIRGCFMVSVGKLEKDEFIKRTLPAMPGVPGFNFIDELSTEDQAVAWIYVKGK